MNLPQSIPIHLLFTLLIIALSGWLLHGFLLPMTWALILAIATWPLFARLNQRMGQRGAPAAALMTLLVVVILILPLAWLAWQVAVELVHFSHFLVNAHLYGIPPPPVLKNFPHLGAPLERFWHTTLGRPHGLYDFLQPYAATQLEMLRPFIFGTEQQLLHRATIFFLTVLILFFLYKDGERLASQANRLGSRWFVTRWPFYSKSTVEAVRAVANGIVIVGLGEGLLIGLSYWLSGVAVPFLLTAVTCILCMIPFAAPLGFGLAALVLVIQGKLLAALFVFVWGMVMTFMASHFVQPVIIGGSLRLPFLGIFLSMFGGMATFGLSGLFVGPIVISLAMDLWRSALGEPAGITDHTVERQSQSHGYLAGRLIKRR